MSTPLGPPTGTYAPPTDLPGTVKDCLRVEAITRPTPEAMTWADLLARDEALREGIDGATRAGDLGRARALFLERLGVGREIGKRRAVALAAAGVPADEGAPVRPIGPVSP